MVAIPEPYNFTVNAIWQAYEKRAIENAYDNYGIPISMMGDECDRKLWYILRWAFTVNPVPAVTQRLFDTGYVEEDRLLNDLRAAGFDVLSEDPATGASYRIELVRGWLRGKADGTVQGLPEAPKALHVVECKSHNDKSFKELKKSGLPNTHYVQCQIYMHGLHLQRCLYVAVNKNTDELYVERVRYDKALCESLMLRAERILSANTAPSRISEDAEFYLCRFCDARFVCHEGLGVRSNCRTCISSSFADNAELHCALWKTVREKEEQRLGCTKHLFLPSLVAGEQIDADESRRTITYRMPDGSIWTDGDPLAAA